MTPKQKEELENEFKTSFVELILDQCKSQGFRTISTELYVQIMKNSYNWFEEKLNTLLKDREEQVIKNIFEYLKTNSVFQFEQNYVTRFNNEDYSEEIANCEHEWRYFKYNKRCKICYLALPVETDSNLVGDIK